MITGLWECVSTEQSVIDFWRLYHSMYDSGVMKMNKNNSSESSVFTERVVQGPDRVYRWKYTLRKEQALVHYKMMMKIGMIVAAAISAVTISIFAFGAQDRLIFGNLLLNILVIYGMIVGLPALIGALVLNSDTRSYEMDDECIRHKHATRGGDAVVIFRNVTWADEEENAIRMKEGITTYTMYAPPEDATFVKEYIRNRIGSEKYKS